MAKYIQKQTKDYESIVENLRLFGIKHDIEIGSVSLRVITGEKHIVFSDEHITGKELAFISKVKREASKFTGKLIECTPSDIMYVKYNLKAPKKGKMFYRDLVELDVNKAYWSIALIDGIISIDTYLEGLEHRKLVRLMCIGSLGSNRSVFRYDTQARDYYKVGNNTDEFLRGIYLHICKRLDLVMNSGSFEYYFYWVDAFFTTKQEAERIREYLIYYHSLDSKISTVNMTVTSSRIYVCCIKEKEIDRCNIRIKSFNFPSRESRSRILKKSEDNTKDWVI